MLPVHRFDASHSYVNYTVFALTNMMSMALYLNMLVEVDVVFVNHHSHGHLELIYLVWDLLLLYRLLCSDDAILLTHLVVEWIG